MIDLTDISFRRLCEGDLPLLHKWLNTDFVMEWYQTSDRSMKGIQQKYVPRITGAEPCCVYIVTIGGEEVGLIQTYKLVDYPTYYAHLDVEQDDCSSTMDVFIGNERYLHKGFGSKIIERFLEKVVFADPTVEKCYIEPATGNTVAMKAYEKAGFKFIKELPPSHGEEAGVLMFITREGWSRPDLG